MTSVVKPLIRWFRSKMRLNGNFKPLFSRKPSVRALDEMPKWFREIQNIYWFCNKPQKGLVFARKPRQLLWSTWRAGSVCGWRASCWHRRDWVECVVCDILVFIALFSWKFVYKNLGMCMGSVKFFVDQMICELTLNNEAWWKVWRGR